MQKYNKNKKTYRYIPKHDINYYILQEANINQQIET